MALCNLWVKSWFLASHYSCKFFCLNPREWDIHFPEMCKGRLFLCSFSVSKHVLHSLYNCLLHSAPGWLLFVPPKSSQMPLFYKPSWPSSVPPFPPHAPLEPSAYLYFTICSFLIVWASPQPTCQPLRAGLYLVFQEGFFWSDPSLPHPLSAWVRCLFSGFSLNSTDLGSESSVQVSPSRPHFLVSLCVWPPCVLMANMLVGDQLILVCLRLSLVYNGKSHNSTPGYTPENIETGTQTHTCTPMFTAALLTRVKRWKQPKCHQWMNG